MKAEQTDKNKKGLGMKAKNRLANTAIYIILIVMSVIWLVPFFCIVFQSFRTESTRSVGYVIPKKWGLDNYKALINTDWEKKVISGENIREDFEASKEAAAERARNAAGKSELVEILKDFLDDSSVNILASKDISPAVVYIVLKAPVSQSDADAAISEIIAYSDEKFPDDAAVDVSEMVDAEAADGETEAADVVTEDESVSDDEQAAAEVVSASAPMTVVGSRKINEIDIQDAKKQIAAKEAAIAAVASVQNKNELAAVLTEYGATVTGSRLSRAEIASSMFDIALLTKGTLEDKNVQAAMKDVAKAENPSISESDTKTATKTREASFAAACINQAASASTGEELMTVLDSYMDSIFGMKVEAKTTANSLVKIAYAAGNISTEVADAAITDEITKSGAKIADVFITDAKKNVSKAAGTSKLTAYVTWYLNTFLIACFVAIVQTIIVLCTSYSLSRFRFKLRKPFMKFMLVLSMFPGILTMIILYRVLKDLGLTLENARYGLMLVYVASSGMGYYISKGYFDTIPTSLDEAARVDGATRLQVLVTMILPLAKPIVIYSVLQAFMAPWADFVFAKYISFNASDGMNVAVGLYSWLNKDMIASRYTMFCAGGVLVAIPIVILFMCMQKYYVEGMTHGSVKG